MREAARPPRTPDIALRYYMIQLTGACDKLANTKTSPKTHQDCNRVPKKHMFDISHDHSAARMVPRYHIQLTATSHKLTDSN